MQEKKILIQMRDLRVGSGIASCIMKYYEYTVEQGYTIDFLLNRNIDSPFVDTVKKHNSKIYLLPHDTRLGLKLQQRKIHWWSCTMVCFKQSNTSGE